MTQPRGDVVSARLLDLSLNGARLVQPVSLAVGAVHEFAFELGGETLRVRARVRHCYPAEGEPGYQVGVQFVGVEPQAEHRLQSYVKTETKRKRRRGRA